MQRLPFFVLTLLLLISCKKTKEEYETYTDLQPLHFGIIQTMDCLPFIIAQEKGYYDSLGLELSISTYTSINERNTAFQSGQVDGTIIDYTEAIASHANGTPLGIVMETNGSFQLITGKDSRISSLQELKGKNIAVAHGTATEYCADLLLSKGGINPEEVNMPEITSSALRARMLQNQQIDATILPDPFATIAISGGGHSLVTTKSSNTSVTGVIFSTTTLEQKRREIEVLLRGYNFGVTYIEKHSRNDWKDILIRSMGISENIANSIQLPSYKKARTPSHKELESASTWLKAKDLIPEDYNGVNLVDTIKGVRVK